MRLPYVWQSPDMTNWPSWFWVMTKWRHLSWPLWRKCMASEMNQKSAKEAIERRSTDLICLTCRTGCSRWLYHWGEWENSPELYLSTDLPCPWSRTTQSQLNRLTGKLHLKITLPCHENSLQLVCLFYSLSHTSLRENKALLMILSCDIQRHQSCQIHWFSTLRTLYLESSRLSSVPRLKARLCNIKKKTKTHS